MGVVTIDTPGYNTLESLVLIDGDIISTTRSVLDCCNGYYGYMKPVYSWLLVVIMLVHLAINYVVRRWW